MLLQLIGMKAGGESLGKTVPVRLALIAVFFSVLCIAPAVLGMDAQERNKELVIRDARSGDVVWSAKLSEGETFSIRYIHSVDKLPVHEFYINEDGELILTGIKVIDFGAGLDYVGEGDLRMEGKWTYIDNLQRKIDSLPLRVGSIADHTLIYRDKEIYLRNHFPAFTLVRIELR
jgi:hypothetical protein